MIKKTKKIRRWHLEKSNNRGRTRLANYFEQHLIKIEPTLHPNTHRRYSQIVHDHINPIIGSRRLQNLNPSHIQKLYSIKLKSGLSPGTVHYIHKVLSRALTIAVGQGYIEHNPAKFVSKPQKVRREMKTFSNVEVRILLREINGSRLEALYYLAVTTGLRQAEILGLKWPDLDKEKGTIRVQRQLQRVIGKGLTFTKPKTASSRRLVVLGPTTLEKLIEHKDRQDFERIGFGKAWQTLDLMFIKPNGSPIGSRCIIRDFKSIIQKAVLPDIRFHDLRHTAATLMLQCDVHPKVVQEMLGHSSITITLDTYSHVLPVMQYEAARKLDELLNHA
jgi:integrase